MFVPVTKIHNRLSHWLSQVHKDHVIITRRGKPVGVLVSPEEYERLRQVEAYLKMIRLSRSLQEADVTADELLRTSREELEARP
jgi:prevent-host-death family protein